MLIYARWDGSKIGDVDNGILVKNVDGREHRLNRPPAWAIDCGAYKEDVLPYCHTIIINDTHARVRYSVSVKLFDLKKGYLNRGHGPQYYLTLNHWQTTGISQGVLL